jgi:hypothetical protein
VIDLSILGQSLGRCRSQCVSDQSVTLELDNPIGVILYIHPEMILSIF